MGGFSGPYWRNQFSIDVKSTKRKHLSAIRRRKEGIRKIPKTRSWRETDLAI
jgi:hypothetical protein